MSYLTCIPFKTLHKTKFLNAIENTMEFLDTNFAKFNIVNISLAIIIDGIIIDMQKPSPFLKTFENFNLFSAQVKKIIFSRYALKYNYI